MQADTFAAQAIPLVMILFAFYCIVLRPGNLTEARRWKAVRSMTGGERVTFASGIVGTFVGRHGGEEDGEYEIEVCAGVTLRVRERCILTVDEPDRELAASG
jgi:preprotein translocase YajC subunit